MKPYQFWILLLISLVVSGLLIKQIFLSRTLAHAQANLIDNEEVASTAASFENAWQKLAMGLYQAAPQDSALLEVLKRQNIGIKVKASAPSANAPAPAVSPTPATTPTASNPATP
jgi:hypothetical protein